MINKPINKKFTKNDMRQKQRFKVRDGALAFFNPNPSILGSIIDISEDGLAFAYMDNNSSLPEEKPTKLDILISDDGFYLDQLPFETVANFELPNEYSFSTVIMKRLCLKFGKLSKEQKKQLDYFISKYTIKEN